MRPSAFGDKNARATSDAGLAGATLGAGLVSFVTGGVAVAMAVVCLIGFAVAHLMGREMTPEAVGATKRCPECAELVQAAARRCKHCGATFVSESPA
jgi:tRNA(Ile2) C34 agmatinyltransferase TiaS